MAADGGFRQLPVTYMIDRQIQFGSFPDDSWRAVEARTELRFFKVSDELAGDLAEAVVQLANGEVYRLSGYWDEPEKGVLVSGGVNAAPWRSGVAELQTVLDMRGAADLPWYVDDPSFLRACDPSWDDFADLDLAAALDAGNTHLIRVAANAALSRGDSERGSELLLIATAARSPFGYDVACRRLHTHGVADPVAIGLLRYRRDAGCIDAQTLLEGLEERGLAPNEGTT